MEKGEAKMCRLCGQYERIYIDVFGEEGIKRFLGRKIHTKINILVSSVIAHHWFHACDYHPLCAPSVIMEEGKGTCDLKTVKI